MNNTRFATVIHILTLLDHTGEDWVSSDWIAGSININPVMVRKELSILADAGWVISKKGKVGGSRLNIPADEIKLSDIYRVVKNSDVLGKKNLKTNPKCPVGKDINEKLDGLFSEVDQLVMQQLEGKTLATFAAQFV